MAHAFSFLCFISSTVSFCFASTSPTITFVHGYVFSGKWNNANCRLANTPAVWVSVDQLVDHFVSMHAFDFELVK